MCWLGESLVSLMEVDTKVLRKRARELHVPIAQFELSDVYVSLLWTNMCLSVHQWSEWEISSDLINITGVRSSNRSGFVATMVICFETKGIICMLVCVININFACLTTIN